MNRGLWILLVLFVALMASVLAATLANMIRHGFRPPANSTRNAPKGAAAVVFWVLAGLGCGGLVLLVGVSLVILLVQSIGDPGPGDAPPPPQNQIPAMPAAEDLGPKEKQTIILGGVNNPTFKDVAPDGGLLIGFDVGLGQAFGVELVKIIRPVYRTPKSETPGRQFGTDFDKRVTVRANPGYAVGAVNVKAGLMVNGFSVKFMRIKGDRLDPNDSYSSPWIGDQTGGGGPTLLTGDGTPIIGIIGKRNATECMGIGLLKQ